MVARMCLVPDRRIESRFHDSAWSATTSVVNRSLNMFTINEFLAADLHARDTLSTEAHYEDPRSVRPARPARSPSCLVALMLRALPRDTAPGALADEGRARSNFLAASDDSLAASRPEIPCLPLKKRWHRRCSLPCIGGCEAEDASRDRGACGRSLRLVSPQRQSNGLTPRHWPRPRQSPR